MQRRALAGAMLALVATVANAADLPVGVPAAPPPYWPRTWDWTGFYGGINAGYSFGKERDGWNIAAAPPSTFAVIGTDSETLRGPLGGIQAGFNWQISYFVFGFESDIDFAGETGKQTFNSGSTIPTVVTGVSIPHSDRLNWIGTARGRFGAAFGQALIYGTAGFAWGAGREQVSATATRVSDSSTVVLVNPSSLNTVLTGWTAGGGAELALDNNWTVRAEYLHVDFGTTNRGFPTQAVPMAVGTGTLVPAGSGTLSARITDNIVRLGLNWKFQPF
jgi:outer membrane immunogenic protein